MSNQLKTETETFISTAHRQAFDSASNKTDAIPRVIESANEYSIVEHVPNEVTAISPTDAKRILDAIQTATEHDCYHFDLDLSNLRRRENGEIVVIDWGHSYFYPESSVFFTRSAMPRCIDFSDPKPHELRWGVVFLFGEFLEDEGYQSIGEELQTRLSFKRAEELLHDCTTQSTK